MKAGKVSQTVYRRSILKQLHTDDQAALFTPAQGESCYGICAEAGEKILSCDVSLYGNEKDLAVFAIAQAANHLASRGAQIKGVSIQILLPDFAYESRLKAMIAAAEDTAARQGIVILAADAQVAPFVTTTVVHVSASGTVPFGQLRLGRMAAAGQEIVLINHIGLEGTLRIKRAKEAELAERFIPAFLNKIETYRSEIFSLREMEAAAAIGVSAMHQIVDGGILGALWDLAEGAGIGLCADLRKMAVRQETIELCEYFHLNPYQLTSAGSVLVVTARGEELADTLTGEGMYAVVIGHTAAGSERVIMNGGERRYLDRPAPDELVKLLQM